MTYKAEVKITGDKRNQGTIAGATLKNLSTQLQRSIPQAELYPLIEAAKSDIELYGNLRELQGTYSTTLELLAKNAVTVSGAASEVISATNHLLMQISDEKRKTLSNNLQENLTALEDFVNKAGALKTGAEAAEKPMKLANFLE